MSINRDDISTVANLARIQVSDEEIPRITESINEILGLVDRMQKVDTEQVLPLANPHDATQTLREDEVTASNQREKLMANAPNKEDGLFLVPRVIE